MKIAREKASNPPKRPRTFSGCQTCRSRHLKCDEERPACRRCTKAKLRCSGYPGYRAKIGWKPVQGTFNHDLEPAVHSSTSPLNEVSTVTVDGIGAAGQRIEIIALPENGGGRSEPLEQAFRTCTTISSPLNDQLLTRTLVAAPGTHLDSLSNLKLQLQLIDHWMNMLSDALMPTPGSYNPNKDIFVPIALEGACSPVTETSGSVALFYLLFAASAFHLSTNCGDMVRASKLMSVTLSHHNRDISHLQRNLASDEPDQQEAIISSLLLCTTYEPVTVETSFWRTHFSGASSWLRKKDLRSLTWTESSAMLYQTLVGTAIFLRSQLTFDEIGLDENFPFDIQTALTGPYYLSDVFGLPKSTFQEISNIISMVTKLRHHSCSQTPDCVSSSCSLYSEHQLDRMGLKLYLGLPKDPEDTIVDCKANITYHYTRIFYYASLIYFKRILRSYPLASVQPIIEQSLYHIEALEGCTKRAFSPFGWPIAIAFLEMEKGEYQKRAIAWLDFITKRSQLSIWPKVKKMVRAFWSKRDAAAKGGRDLQWDVYLSDPETPDIMMV